MNPFQDAFISYGRADSLEFATWLNQRLMAAGFTVWFDYEDIPKAVPFQKQIDDGIVKADNFLCIVSPRSINSYNCQLEVQHAIACGKRIIPIIHVEQITYETWRSRHPHSPDDEWATFQAEGKHDYFANMPPILRKLNWLNCRDGIEDREAFVQELLPVMHQNRDYVHRHTELLVQAQEWERNHKQTHFLLTGDRCEQGLTWLKTQLKQSQHPCSPTELQCEFITESLKNANNLMTQVFLAYAHEDKAVMEQVRRSLWREGIVVWVNANASDIQAGEDFQQAIDQGIEQADNLIYLLSPHALASDQCGRELSYAQALHKRIVPILVGEIEATQDPDRWLERHYIDLTNHATENADGGAISKLLRDLETDADYYQTHKELLVKALKWKHQHRNPSILLRGHDLRQAEIWLKTAQTRDCHLPTALHVDFLEESLRQPPASSLDVFISYSRADADFARRLNDNLQIYGKTTWFDQESIAKASGDFVQEIRRGIDVSNNIVFILSPRSVQSPFCQDEVAYAASLNKRFVTILHQDLGEAVLPAALQTVQWLDFTQTGPNRFWEDFNQLVRVLETDREYLQSHTKWLQQAIEWEQQQRSQDLLLRGSEFAIADQWLCTAKTEEKKPVPTELQTAFIQASAQAIDAEKRKEKLYRFVVRSMLGVMTAVACVTVGIGIVASTNRRQAIHNEIKALASIAEAEFALGQSFDAVVTALKAEDRLRHAHWLRHDQALRDRVTTALQQAVYLGRETHRLEGFDRMVNQAKFSPNGEVLVTLDNQYLQLWNADGSPRLNDEGTAQSRLEITGAAGYGYQLAMNDANGEMLVISGDDFGQFIQRWNLAGELLPTLTPDPTWEWLSVSPNGQTLATSDGDRIQLWQPDGTFLTDLPNSSDVGWLHFSDNGQVMLAFDPDSQQVRLWQLAGGTHTAFTVSADLNFQALSPDGTHAIFSNGDELQVYEADGTLLLTLNRSQMPTNATLGQVTFSPDGQTIAASYNFQRVNRDPFVKIWNAQGELQAALDGHDASISTLKFSPDSQYLATASSENTVKLWQVDGTLVDTLLGHADHITRIDFTPDSAILATGSFDATLRLWTVNSDLAKSASSDQSFMDQGQTKLITSITNGPVRLWQVDGSPIATLVENNTGELAGQWSGNGETFVSVASQEEAFYGPVQVWDANGELQATLIEQTTTSEDETNQLITPVVNHAGDRIITLYQTAETFGPVKLWSREGELLATLLEAQPKTLASLDHWQYQSFVRFLGQSSLIVTQPKTADQLGPVQLWDAQGRLLQTLIEPLPLPTNVADETHREYVTHVISDEAGDVIVSLLATPETYGPANLWNSQGEYQATLIERINRHAGQNVWHAVQIDPAGQTVVTAPAFGQTLGPVQLWDTQGNFISTLIDAEPIPPDNFAHLQLTYSPAGNYFVSHLTAADTYGPAQLWNAQGDELGTLMERSPIPETIDNFAVRFLFSEDEQTLVTGAAYGAVQRWQTVDATLLNTMMPQLVSENIWGLALSPDGTLLSVPTDAKTYEIWHVEEGLLKVIRGEGDVSDGVFSADSQMFTTGNYDNRVRLWHRDGNRSVTLGGHNATPLAGFSPDGNVLLSQDEDQAIWHQLAGLTELENLVQMGCERVATHLQHGAGLEESDRTLCQGKLPDINSAK